MINVSIPAHLKYVPDDRTVSPAQGDTEGMPDPMVCGSDEHAEQAELVAQTVSTIKAGLMPVAALEQHNLPSDFLDFPEPLSRRIKAKAIEEDVTIPFAWAAVFRMDDPLMMGRLMIDNVLLHGGQIRPEYAYKSNEKNPDNPDLVGRMAAESHLYERITRRMANTFDNKNGTNFPRPWQCLSALPDDVAASLFTLFVDPVKEAGAGHSEFPPGHAANGAESHAAVLDVTEGPDVAYIGNEVIARLGGQGRTAGGLHYWLHCQRMTDHVLAGNGVKSLLSC